MRASPRLGFCCAMELSRAEALEVDCCQADPDQTQCSGNLSSSSSCFHVTKMLPNTLPERGVQGCIQTHSQQGISKSQVTWWVTETSGEVGEELLPISLPSLQALMTPLTATPCTAAP